jgi:competence protein ComEA
VAYQLMDRVDPNTADALTLAALPVLGPALAERIVAHRDELAAKNPARPAFEKLEDLASVRGIGPATLKHLEPYLVFGPADRPSPPP